MERCVAGKVGGCEEGLGRRRMVEEERRDGGVGGAGGEMELLEESVSMGMGRLKGKREG